MIAYEIGNHDCSATRYALRITEQTSCQIKRYQKFGVRNYRIREGLDSDTKSVIKIELQRSKTPTQRHVGRTRRCESWTDSRLYATRSLKHVRLWGSPVDNAQAHSFHSSMPFQYADKQPQDAAASPRRCRPSTVPYNS